jgi:hypothetical protein
VHGWRQAGDREHYADRAVRFVDRAVRLDTAASSLATRVPSPSPGRAVVAGARRNLAESIAHYVTILCSRTG